MSKVLKPSGPMLPVKVSLPLSLILSYTDQPPPLEKVSGRAVMEAAMSEASEKAFVVTRVAYCLYRMQKKAFVQRTANTEEDS